MQLYSNCIYSVSQTKDPYFHFCNPSSKKEKWFSFRCGAIVRTIIGVVGLRPDWVVSLSVQSSHQR